MDVRAGIKALLTAGQEGAASANVLHGLPACSMAHWTFVPLGMAWRDQLMEQVWIDHSVGPSSMTLDLSHLDSFPGAELVV